MQLCLLSAASACLYTDPMRPYRRALLVCAIVVFLVGMVMCADLLFIAGR